MTPYPQSIINALRAQRAQLDDANRVKRLGFRTSLEQAIRACDEKWELVDRKHERSLRESISDSWSNSLRSLHAERKRKSDEGRSRLVCELEKLPVTHVADELDMSALEVELTDIDREIFEYHETLSIKRRQTEISGSYGEIDDEKWIKEVFRFVDRNPNVCRALSRLLQVSLESDLTVDWRLIIAQRVNELIEPAASLPAVSPSDGSSFEHSCLLALDNSGWSATLTPPTGDQGVDILAKKNDISVALQCKNYRAPVGNGAVQEVHAGKSFYEADVAVVVSLSGYTPSASQLAKKLRVLLLVTPH